MSNKKDLEIFLYKNKLNTSSVIDLLPKLSSKTISYLFKDLSIIEKNKTSNDDIHAFTDGNCKRNGKQNAKAGYSVFFTDDESSELYNLNKVGLLTTSSATNQKAELTALKVLFKTINENLELFKNKNLIICSDSLYSIKCLTEWYKKWETNNWKTSSGEEVKNNELIKRIIELKKKCENDVKITFKHVFSHIREPDNKESYEYFLWRGNKMVDDNINKILD